MPLLNAGIQLQLFALLVLVLKQEMIVLKEFHVDTLMLFVKIMSADMIAEKNKMIRIITIERV